MQAVVARGVRKRYGTVEALAGADLDVAPGAVTGLLGPNGAGKTTLLRVLLGLARPDGGDVCVLGAAPGPPHDGVAGFVDAPRWWPYLTGRRTLRLLAALDGDDAAPVEQVLDTVGLTSAAGTRVAGWSTGMRQRLGLAAALLRRPRLLVLDEPTSGLDPGGTERVHALLRGLAADGVAVLVSSHDLAEVQAVCDDVVVLAGGRTRWAGPLSALHPSTPGTEYRLRTSDDGVALALSDRPGLQAEALAVGLRVVGEQDDVDRLVLELGARGVAVRALEAVDPPAARAFRELTTPVADGRSRPGVRVVQR